jgi:LPS-assembly lipoprotein
MRLSFKTILMTLVSLGIVSCGFQLRGQAKLPSALAVTYIKAQNPPGSRPGELPSRLERALVTNGVKVTADPKEATATLEILRETTRRRTLAAGSSVTESANLREYTFSYEVDYQVTLADGKKLIPQQTLSTSRNLFTDESKVLGKTAGEEILTKDMVSDVVRSIILRLQAANR